MTKPIAEATVIGDFRDGTKFADHDRAYTFGTKDGKPFVSDCRSATARRRPSPSTTRSAPSDIRAICRRCPTAASTCCRCSGTSAAKRWIDWKEITSMPGRRARPPADLERQLFQLPRAPTSSRATTSPRRSTTSTWTEMGIGCEACHGPGRQHVALMEAWEKDPASKPKYDNSSKNRQLSDILKILSVKSSEPRRIYDTCAYCHGNKRNVVRRIQGRRSLLGLRDAVPHQRSASRQRSAGRVLA